MYHISKLKNGITLITVPVDGTRATTVLAMFPIGSRYETQDISGASHFVEHMMFKGTTHRPTAETISRELDAVGAEYNAFTNKDYTGYYVKIDAEKSDVAFDLLSDMIFNSLIEEKEVEKEKGAIVEELRMYDDNPLMAIDQLSDRLSFGDTPLGWDVGGTATTVRAITREKLWHYYQSHYHPRNMVLVVAGNVSKKMLKKNLPYFENHKAPNKALGETYYRNHFVKFAWPSKVALEHRVAVKEKKLDQAQVIINFPGIKVSDNSRYAQSLLLNILGGTMSSRLFQEVREKRGLAYMVRAGGGGYRDVGHAYVQTGLDPARLAEAFTVIKAEVVKIATALVSEREHLDAKSNFSGRLALSTEDSSFQAEWYAKNFLFHKKIETPDEVLKKIKQVKREDILKLARRIFNWDEARVAAIGPVGKADILKMV